MHKANRGFTLVEMSIVLVIIGLIVGGVLVGQDLVKAAQIRAVVTQLQQYDAAINTFRGKYDGFPGDISKADKFGLGATNGSQNGDGNGRLDDGQTAVSIAASFDQELSWFWLHLSNANMVPGQFDGQTAGSIAADAQFPATKLKKGGVIAISEGATNVWVVGTEADLLGDNFTTGAGILGNNLTPTEAFGIDNKLDDGITNTGQVLVFTNFDGNAFTYVNAVTSSSTFCWAGGEAATTDPADYLLANETNSCTLRIRVQG